MIYDKSKNTIYNFDLTYEDEAKLLWKFRNEDHEILFPFYESNFNANADWKEKIAARTLIKSKERVFEIVNEKLKNDVCYWYRPFNLEDLVEILMLDGITCQCLIIPIDGELKDWKYQLHIHEHGYYEQCETRVLWIKESEENEFHYLIYPTIKSDFLIDQV